MSETRDQLWAELRAASLVDGTLPADQEQSPWFVRLMLGIAGWIGALFMLAFFGIALESVVREAFTAIGVGAAVCAAATILFRLGPQNDFLLQFGFAVSLAGQGLILLGLSNGMGSDEAAVAFCMALVEALLFVAVPGFVHRAWSSAAAVLALAFALVEWGLLALLPGALTLCVGLLWLGEFGQARRGPLLRAAGYGVSFALVLVILFQAGYLDWGWRGFTRSGLALTPWLGAGLSGAATICILAMLIRREGFANDPHAVRVALVGSLVIALATVKAPGLGPAAVILLLGFANGNAVLAGFGLLALLAYLAQYYYSLQVTLLEKSMILAGAGIALLMLRQLLRRYWPAPADPGAGDA